MATGAVSILRSGVSGARPGVRSSHRVLPARRGGVGKTWLVVPRDSCPLFPGDGNCRAGALPMITRAAVREDAAAMADIYNQGIEDRVATFETRLRSAADVEAWFDGAHPVVVMEDAGRVIAFASTSTYRPRECYAGIAEVSAYVTRNARGRGAGRAVLGALFDA